MQKFFRIYAGLPQFAQSMSGQSLERVVTYLRALEVGCCFVLCKILHPYTFQNELSTRLWICSPNTELIFHQRVKKQLKLSSFPFSVAIFSRHHSAKIVLVMLTRHRCIMTEMWIVPTPTILWFCDSVIGSASQREDSPCKLSVYSFFFYCSWMPVCPWKDKKLCLPCFFV